MSVYTTVSEAELATWLQNYDLGELRELKGIAAGVTNTNYFVTTSKQRSVLTLFETLTLNELPFYLEVMHFLAKNNIAVPAPITDQQHNFCSELCGKPACLVECLQGSDLNQPSLDEAAQLATMLARVHLAGAQFAQKMPNPRGAAWRHESARRVLAKLSAAEKQLLNEELQAQAALVKQWQNLPHGLIHADLFRDNVLFSNGKISGIIDWYYACDDAFLYDLAITVNDWCAAPDGQIQPDHARAMLQAYQAVRPLTALERDSWAMMLRVAALRFWLSRLLDFHFPQAGEMTFAKDPRAFENILRQHRQRTDFWLEN